jgi:hypothetical protein
MPVVIMIQSKAPKSEKGRVEFLKGHEIAKSPNADGQT